MSEVVFDFSGKQIDRSEIDLRFDGLTLKITVENQSHPDRFTSIIFEYVVDFTFESLVALLDYPQDIDEKLVRNEARDFLSKRQSQYGPILDERINEFRVFFQDIGTFRVFSRTAKVSEQP